MKPRGALKKIAAVTVREGLTLAGAAMVVYGLDMLSRPTAIVVAGIVVLIMARGVGRSDR
jgi:hypothetical protein